MFIAMITGRNSKRGMFTARVEQNIPLCEEHYRLVLKVMEFPPSSPGQFIELHTRLDVPEPGYRITEWAPGARPGQLGREEFRTPAPLLRRPYSIAAHTVDGAVSTVEIIYRVIGKMTRTMQLCGREIR